MKHNDSVARFIEKYKMNYRVPFFTASRILLAKYRTHSRILRSENPGLIGVRTALAWKYILRFFGADLSLHGSVRLAYASCAIAFCVTATALFFIISPHIGEQSAAIRMISSDGTTRVIRNGSSVNPSSPDFIPTNGDIIETLHGSSVLLRSGNHGILLMSDSRCAVNTSPDMTGITLTRGTILLNNGNTPEKTGCEVSTPNAVITVKGTLFSVTYDETATHVAVREGTVEVTRKGSSDSRTINAGSKAVVSDETRVESISEDESSRLSDYNRIGKTGKESSSDRTIMRTINNAEEKPVPLTLEQIKSRYGYIEQLTLYNGKILYGATISRTHTVRFITPSGLMLIPARDIQGLKTIK